jgi:colanic acid/amylovoran biosynthesis glycosyltransferase
MNIAFFVDRFPYISETFILNQVTGLLDRGHHVDIYARRIENQPLAHSEVEHYNLLNRTFQHGHCSPAMPKNKFLRLTKALGLIATNLNGRPHPLLNSLNILKYGKKAASLRLFFDASIFIGDGQKYDIVHCHFGPNGNLAVLLKAIGAIKGKVVTTFHGYDITQYLRKHGNNVYHDLFYSGDLFLPISERWKRKLIELGCHEEKIIVHHMGIDTEKFLFSPRRPDENGAVKIISTARLVEKKGIQYSVKAVARAVKKFPYIEYGIVGDGPLRGEIEDLINELELKGHVRMYGWMKQEEVIELMKQSHVFLAPSVTSKEGDQEGIPVALMEAMAQGLPVLSTDHSGIPELVQNGKSGFLVPERDVEALANKLEYLVEHPGIWPEMGKAGRDHVKKHYDIHRLNDRLVEIFQSLLDRDDYTAKTLKYDSAQKARDARR